MSALKTWLRRLRTLLWTALALVIITAAVLVGIGKLLMPYSERFKPRLEAVLAEQFNQPVRLDAFTGEWKAFGPRISMVGLNLLGGEDGEDALAIERAALDIKPLNVLLAGKPLYSFRIIGVDLALVRGGDGTLELSGLGLSGRRLELADDRQRRSGGLANLARVGEVRLEDSRFSFRDEAQDLQFRLTGIDGRLQMGGDSLALELEASLSDLRRGIVLGDLALTVRTDLVDGRNIRDAEFHVETGELLLAEAAAQLPDHALKPIGGRVNAQLWGSWSPGDPLRIVGVADLRDATLDTGEQRLTLDRLNARLRWRWRDKTQWRIDLADARVEAGGLDWDAPRISVERNLDGGVAAWVAADYLRAEFPLAAVQLFMKELGYRWPKAAPTAGRGVVRDFDLVINDNRKLALATGRFDDLEVLAWDRWPLPRGLTGDIDLAFGQGSVRFSGEEVAIHWDRNFRRPLVATLSDCEVEILWDEDNRWQVDALPCPVVSPVLEGEARARFVRDEGKPRVDVNAIVRRAELAELDDYWPASVMSPKVTGWLRRGIGAGTVRDARVVLQGDMDRFPFRDGGGTVLGLMPITGADLDYAPGWPAARNIDATARFAGPGFTIDGRIGDLAGSPVQSASAHIADLAAPVIEFDYRSETDLGLLRDFVEASPMLADRASDLERFGFGGPATAEGRLRIPLGTSPGQTVLDGTLTVAGGEFIERRSGFRLEGLEGAVAYTRTGLAGDGIAATLAGWPADLNLAAAWDADTPFTASLTGRFPASLLAMKTPLADDPLLARIDGETDWSLGLAVIRDPGQGDGEVWLEAATDLEGVAVPLPAPLNKPAAARWPLKLRYPIRSARPVVQATLAGRLDVALELDRSFVPGIVPTIEPDTTAVTGLRRGAVALGGGAAVLPAAGRFTLGGAAKRLDLDGWADIVIDYAREERHPTAMAFEASAVRVGALDMLNRRFTDVLLGLEADGSQLVARLAGEAIDGEVSYRRNDDGTHAVAAQLERLWLPEPLSAGDGDVSAPTAWPEMRFYVRDFRFLGLDLGQTRMEAYPIAGGLRFETVESSSEQLNFEARGDWLETGTGSRSDFDIVLTSESLGGIVNALDLSSVLEGGQTMVRYDAWWPGSPTAFKLARLNGEMTFSVVDGRILNADPGAGRVLGLVSLGALPRRLALDFSDVFSSGFGFDQANGTIQFDDGTARTEDFILESTAAQLSMVGESDLEAREFDYLVTVRPGVSQALPVLGGIAAGPAGLAAGIALQELLRNALGEAAEARYEITGPWSAPEVLRLDPAQEPVAEQSTAQAVTEGT